MRETFFLVNVHRPTNIKKLAYLYFLKVKPIHALNRLHVISDYVQVIAPDVLLCL